MYVIPGILKNGIIYNNPKYYLKTIHNKRLVERGWFLVDRFDQYGYFIIIDYIPSFDKPLPNFLNTRKQMTYEEFQHYTIE